MKTILDHKLFVGETKRGTGFTYLLLLHNSCSLRVALHLKLTAISLSQIADAVRAQNKEILFLAVMIGFISIWSHINWTHSTLDNLAWLGVLD